MKAGFLSDAHGNPHGLRACLAALRQEGVTQMYFLGDAVGYFPEANEVFDLLRSAGATCLRGNHEAMLLGELPVPEGRAAVYRLDEARSRLRPVHRDWIAAWPARLDLDLEGTPLLLVHGSPEDPLRGYLYPDSDLSGFAGLPVAAVLMGHTHRPFVKPAGAVTIVNVGSSGMPRDAGSLASCAMYDSDTRRFTILRTGFDAEGLAARWTGRIHPAAAACLRRPPEPELVGSLVTGQGP